jgi:hypothetical protein
VQEETSWRGRIGRALALLGMVEAARAQGMDAADIGLLVVLASHADEGGAAHPSQSTLAREVGRERPWVNRRLAALVNADLGDRKALEKARRRLAKGGETSCIYRLTPPATPPVRRGITNRKNPTIKISSLRARTRQRARARASGSGTRSTPERSAPGGFRHPRTSPTPPLRGPI